MGSPKNAIEKFHTNHTNHSSSVFGKTLDQASPNLRKNKKITEFNEIKEPNTGVNSTYVSSEFSQIKKIMKDPTKNGYLI